MNRSGIIAAGNWVVDKVKNIDRWPEEGELCNIASETIGGGGGPCNVLFDLVVMDNKLDLFASGLLGCDKDGDWFLEEIKKRNIDSGYMKKSNSASSSYTDVMSGGGKRTFFHCRGANSEFGSEHLEDVTAPTKIFYLAYLLLLDKMDSYDADYGTDGARALKMMKDRGYKTVVDFVSDAGEKFNKVIPPSLPYIDCLVINEVEAGHCLGKAIRDANGDVNWANLEEATTHLLDKGVNELVVIHLPEGAIARKKSGEMIYEPSCYIKKKDIVGSTGAGDAFCAGILYALHEEYNLKDMLQLAAASSYFNLLSPTASDGAVSLDKLNQHLKTCEFEQRPEYFKNK